MIIPLSIYQVASGVLCPILVSTIQKRHRQTGKGPNKGHSDAGKAGESAL